MEDRQLRGRPNSRAQLTRLEAAPQHLEQTPCVERVGVKLTLSTLSSLPGRAQSQTQSLNDWTAPGGQGRKGWVSGCLRKEENVGGPRQITPRLTSESPASPLHPGSLRQAAMCNVVSGHWFFFFFFNGLILFLFHMYIYSFSYSFPFLFFTGY